MAIKVVLTKQRQLVETLVPNIIKFTPPPYFGDMLAINRELLNEVVKAFGLPYDKTNKDQQTSAAPPPKRL